MYTTQEQTSLKAFAAQVSESILAAYHLEFEEVGNSLEAEEYTAEAMYEYILDWGHTNGLSAEACMSEFKWNTITAELGLDL